MPEISFGRTEPLRRTTLLRAARIKGTHTKLQWWFLREEAKGICPRCKENGRHLEKDHIVPLCAGGSDGIDNIQPLCARCNSSKSEAVDFFKKQRKSAIRKHDKHLQNG